MTLHTLTLQFIKKFNVYNILFFPKGKIYLTNIYKQ